MRVYMKKLGHEEEENYATRKCFGRLKSAADEYLENTKGPINMWKIMVDDLPTELSLSRKRQLSKKACIAKIAYLSLH